MDWKRTHTDLTRLSRGPSDGPYSGVEADAYTRPTEPLPAGDEARAVAEVERILAGGDA